MKTMAQRKPETDLKERYQFFFREFDSYLKGYLKTLKPVCVTVPAERCK
jgi:hypothetical protein